MVFGGGLLFLGCVERCILAVLESTCASCQPWEACLDRVPMEPVASASTPGSSACGQQVVAAETRAVGFPCMRAHNSCLRQTHCFSNCFCNCVLNVKRSWVTYFFIQNVQNWWVCFVIAKRWVEKRLLGSCDCFCSEYNWRRTFWFPRKCSRAAVLLWC